MSILKNKRVVALAIAAVLGIIGYYSGLDFSGAIQALVGQ